MPELSYSDFLQAINQPEVEPPAQAGPAGSPLTPMTNEALAERATAAELLRRSGTPQTVEPSPWADPDTATKLGARPGIPLDTTSGAPFLTRLRMSAQPTREEVVTALQDLYGKENVRVNGLGIPIFTTKDETGRSKDVLAYPMAMNWEDVSGLLTSVPEMAGALAAIYATKGRTLAPGMLNTAKTLVLTALGTELGGAAKDVAVRGLEGELIQPGEIAKRRTELGVMDVTLGAGLGLAGKTFSLISPFSNAGAKQVAARQAAEYLQNKYGVVLDMTPAEVTGNAFLQRTEAMEAQKPGSSTAFQRFMERRWAEVENLRNIILGTPPSGMGPLAAIPEEEALGAEFLRTAGAKLAPAQFEVEKLAQEIADQAATEIKTAIGPRVSQQQLGEAIRQKAMNLRASFKAQDAANYDAFYSHPLANQNIVDAGLVADPIRKLIKQFPKVEETVQKPTGMLNAQGQPIVATTTQERVLERQIKPGLQSRLDELASLKGGKVSIASLKEIRTDISDAIAQGVAIPGVKEGYLKAAEKALSSAIKDGLDQIGDPQLTQLWKTATQFHRDNVGKFEKAGIAELFRDPAQPNYLGDTEVVSRLTSGKKAQDYYAAYKSFFGGASPEVRGVQQAIRDDVLNLSTLSETIDFKGMVRRLEQLEADAPEVVLDVFGTRGSTLRSSALAAAVAKGETLPKDELAKLVQSGNLSATKLSELASAQAKKDQLFRNDLFRQISTGNLDPEKIRASEIVDRVVFSNKTQPEHLRELVSMVNDRPDLLNDLRRLTFKRVLDDATAVAASGDSVVSANELERVLHGENLSKKLKTVLGLDTFKDLEQLAAFLKPGAIQQQAFKSAGGLVAGSQISNLVERGELSYLARAMKNFVLATVYTHPNLRRYVANTALSPEDKAMFVKTFIASTPFVEALHRTFSGSAARVAAKELGRFSRDESQPPTPGASDIPWEQFLQEVQPAGQASTPAR